MGKRGNGEEDQNVRLMFYGFPFRLFPFDPFRPFLFPFPLTQLDMRIPTSDEPFFELLGLQAEEATTDFARMRLPFTTDLQQARGLVHGGAIASLIDSAGVLAIKATLPDAIGGSTVSMTVNYLAPARQIDLIAEARIIRRGRSIVFLDVDVIAPDGERVAKGQLTYKVTYKKE
jgi:uncharacterized protein (TIGR00369 family)